ncbi:MAG TPA: recombinase family protein [bacterium]|nr:recombinase family protein [bacterium]
MSAAVYARYSSAHQKPTSIDDQVALCRNVAPTFECVVLDDHIYADRELSGAVTQRPAYTRLLEAAQARAFDAIIVEGSDRLWRDTAEMHNALKRLRFWGVKVFAVSTGSDLTTQTGKLLASVVGWKDEAFLDDLRDKIRRGMTGRARDGFSVGGRCYGYTSQPIYDPQKKDPYGNPFVVGYRRVIESGEAEVVRRIYHLYTGGLSPRDITHLFNHEGVTPPRTAGGRMLNGWTYQTLIGSKHKALGILRNPLYVGRLVWNRTRKVRHPDTGKRIVRQRPESEWIWADVPELRIVPDDLWKAVQLRSAQQSHGVGHKTGRRVKYLLSGLLKCECGANYIVRNKSHYGCAAHHDRGPAVCNNEKQAPREHLERVILDRVFNEVLGDPEVIAYLSQKVNEVLANATLPADELRKKHQAELAQARRELTNIERAIRRGLDTKTTRRMVAETEERIARLEAALAIPEEKPKVVYLPSVVEAFARDLKGSLETDPDEARRLLGKLLGRITLRRDGEHLKAEFQGHLRGLLDVETMGRTAVPEEGLEPPRV